MNCKHQKQFYEKIKYNVKIQSCDKFCKISARKWQFTGLKKLGL